MAAALAPDLAGKPGNGTSATGIVRSAMAFEPRDGHLFVFMPPTERTEDYLDLVTAVEDTAEELGQPVFIEGYPPPGSDPRLLHFNVTPDPGVIEVNIHPSGSWNELVDKTEIVYEEARETRLGAQKFMVDGRHTGTGGGNHVTLGGPSAADLPLLRRPDLLKSLQDIGLTTRRSPTCSPACSSARPASIRELTRRATTRCTSWRSPFARSPRPADAALAGRPHLPQSAGRRDRQHAPRRVLHRQAVHAGYGRRPARAAGVAGLRDAAALAHEPTQQALLRGLVAKFWDRPYERPLAAGVRACTTTSCCRISSGTISATCSPTSTKPDIASTPDWFAPHFEFRFPMIGERAQRGIEVELRHALEPWHVLGEEPGGGGTVRYVDSSLERLQVKAMGLNERRHIIACNGWRLPLRATGEAGEYVAGVRYRAWPPVQAT